MPEAALPLPVQQREAAQEDREVDILSAPRTAAPWVFLLIRSPARRAQPGATAAAVTAPTIARGPSTPRAVNGAVTLAVMARREPTEAAAVVAAPLRVSMRPAWGADTTMGLREAAEAAAVAQDSQAGPEAPVVPLSPF